jgi:hypothetical protein
MSAFDNHRMPWGKHRGLRLDQVPSGYLAWVVEESDADDWLVSAVRQVLANRFSRTAPTCGRCERLAVEWPSMYRRLALAVHPDRGGTTEAMQAVNAFDELVGGT